MTQYMLFEAILDRTRSSWFDQHSDDEISSDTHTTSLPMIPTTGKDAEHMVEEQLPNSEKSTNPIEPRGQQQLQMLMWKSRMYSVALQGTEVTRRDVLLVDTTAITLHRLRIRSHQAHRLPLRTCR